MNSDKTNNAKKTTRSTRGGKPWNSWSVMRQSNRIHTDEVLNAPKGYIYDPISGIKPAPKEPTQAPAGEYFPIDTIPSPISGLDAPTIPSATLALEETHIPSPCVGLEGSISIDRPNGIYVVCNQCGNSAHLHDHPTAMHFFTNLCSKCTFFAQSLLTVESKADIERRFTTIREWLYLGSHHGESLLEHYIEIPEAAKKHVNLLEDLCILMHSFIRSTNAFDRYVAMGTFCKLRGNRLSCTSTLFAIMSELFGSCAVGALKSKQAMDMAYESADKHIRQELAESYEAQADEETNIFAEFREHLSMYEKLQNTAIYKKLHKFSLYILTLGLLGGVGVDFNSAGFSSFEAESIKATHRPGFDMIHCMLDTVCFVCDRGIQYFKTRDISTILHSGNAYEKWLTTSRKLLQQAPFLNNPEPHGINRHSYFADLLDAIEKGSSIVKFSTIDKFEKNTLAKMLNDLQMVKATELSRKSAQKPRKDPFAIMIHGSSSIGKSQLKQILFYHYGKFFGHRTEPEFMYTRCPTDEYWSGFQTSKWCIVMDDVAFLKPGSGDIDPTLKELLQVKNSVPYTPPQADIVDKGTIPVQPELLIGTTNTKHLNLKAYFSCPFAIARRMNYYITASVKHEYTKNTFMADSTLIPVTDDGDYMNIWNFTVSVAVPERDEEIDAQTAKLKKIKSFTDIHDMLAWYIEAAEAHELSQKKAASAESSMSGATLCNDCRRNTLHCMCPLAGTLAMRESWVVQAEGDETAIETTIVPPTQSSPPEFNIVDSLSANSADLTWYYRFKLWYVCNVLAMTPIVFSVPHSHGWMLSYMCIALNLVLYIRLWFIPLFIFICFCSYCIRNFFWIMAHYHMYLNGGMWKIRLARQVCNTETDSLRLVFRMFGDKIKTLHYTDSSLKALRTFCGSLAVLFILRQMWKSFVGTNDSEGVSTPIPSHVAQVAVYAPVPAEKEKTTYYYQDPYLPATYDISQQSKCAAPGTVRDKLISATAKFIFTFNGKMMATTAVNICGNLWLLNKHAIIGMEGTLQIIRDDVERNVSRNVKVITFTAKDILVDAKSDLACMELKQLPAGKNLVPYFPTDNILKGRYTGHYILISKNGTRSTSFVQAIKHGICPVFKIPGYSGRVEELSSKGDCGSMCVASVGSGFVILGSHTCGSAAGGVFMQHISQKKLQKFIEKYEPQVEQGIVPVDAPSAPRQVIEVHNKSPVRFLPTGEANVLGSLSGFRPKSKSNVKPTFICDAMVTYGYKAEYAAPDMSGKPWYIALSDMTQPVHTYSTEHIKKCVSSFTQEILSQIRKEDLEVLKPYTQDVALNGVDGVAFVDRINCNTSAGNPYKKSKNHFINFGADRKIESLDPEIQARIEQIHCAYKKGTRFHPQFCGHLKDEPTALKKIKVSKTRLFTGAEFAWSVVVRQYFLPHIRLIQNNPHVFEAMPGIVAQSTEWEDVYNRLCKHGKDRIIAGDYAKFDKKMAAPFILAAFDILIAISKAAGWSDEDLMYLRCIAHDTAFPVVDIKGELIEIQGNPSGHPLTVIINCLVNSLYMRYAFSKIESSIPLTDFQKYVELKTYGDDNILGVSPACTKFSHTSISVVLSTIGVVYTMAEKEAESVPFIHINDASFLKRKFRYDPDIGAVVAPLDRSSFDKMLTSYADNGVISPQAHSICVMETALREYFYYGRVEFEIKRDMMWRVIQDKNLGAYVDPDRGLPLFSSLIIDFWTHSGDAVKGQALAQRIPSRAMDADPITLVDTWV